MTQFWGFIITGLVSGALYSMMATGVVLAYATTGLFNFAQGGIAFVCAYVFFELHSGAHLSTILSGALVMLVLGPLMGLGLDAVAFRRLAGAPEQARIVGTVGLSIALPAFVLLLFTELVNLGHLNLVVGANSVPVSLGPSPAKVWRLFGSATISSDQVIIFAFAAVIALVVWFVVRHTRIGLEMRAAVDARRLAEIRGVDIPRASRAAWALSGLCCGIVGVAGGVVLGLNNDAYTLLLFSAAAAMVIGRLQSIPLAFVGGLALGVIQDLFAGYVNFGFLAQIPGLRSSVPFIILLVGLLVLGNRKGRKAGTAAEARDAPAELTESDRTWRQRLPVIIAIGLVVVYTMFIADSFWAGLMAQGFVMGVIFLSFVVVTGLGGMVSLAQAGFVTAASLFAGWMTVSIGLPFWVAALLGTIIAVLVGMIVALPALRLDGLALALATLALALTLDQVVFAIPSLGNTGQGWTFPKLQIGPWNLAGSRAFAFFCLIVLGVFTVLIRNFERSPSGRAMLAVRGSAPAAQSSGVNHVRIKLITFGFSAAIAGIGGILLAMLLQNVTPSANPPLSGLLWVTIAITFGIRRPVGAIVAGLAAGVSPQLFSYITTSTYLPLILFGLGAVALAQNPEGVLALQVKQIKWVGNNLWEGISFAFSRFPGLSDPARGAAGDGKQVAPAGGVRPAEDVPGAIPGPQDETEIALRLVGLHAGYGEIEVLHGVDLALKKGSVTALLGANGAGKSTLCAVLAGVVPQSSGRLLLGDRDIKNLHPGDRVQAGLFIAPESRGIFPGMTVEDNLRIWLTSTEDLQAAFARFPTLESRRKLNAGSLSGGEQQLLTLAPAFVRLPQVLIADEPTLGLAPLLRSEIMRLFSELCYQGVTVLLIEEKARDVLTIADRVAVLELGRIVWERPRQDVDEDELTRVYLGGTSTYVATSP